MTRLMIGTGLLAAFIAATGCNGGDTPEARADDTALISGDTAAGGDAYGRLCETCHDEDGTGGDAFPDITTYLSARSDVEYLLVMIEGPGGMPAFSTQDDQTLADILAYSRATFDP